MHSCTRAGLSRRTGNRKLQKQETHKWDEEKMEGVGPLFSFLLEPLVSIRNDVDRCPSFVSPRSPFLEPAFSFSPQSPNPKSGKKKKRLGVGEQVSPLRWAARTGKDENRLQRPRITGVCVSGWQTKKTRQISLITHTHTHRVDRGGS